MLPRLPLSYQDVVLRNLEELVDACTVNPRLGLACVSSELDRLFSTLLPRALLAEGAAAAAAASVATTVPSVVDIPLWARALQQAIQGADCGRACQEAMVRSGHNLDTRSSRAEPPMSCDDLRAAVIVAANFVSDARSLAYGIPCACGASILFRFGDALDVIPPADFQLRCSACGAQIRWFIPAPSH